MALGVKTYNQARALNTFDQYQQLSDDYVELLKARHELEIKNNRAGVVWVYKSPGDQCSYGFVGDQTFDIREIGVDAVRIRAGSQIDLNCLNSDSEFNY